MGFAVLLLSCGKERIESTPDKPIAWMTDDEAAARTAATAGKPGLVFVGAEWDTGSKEMHHRTFADRDVRSLVQGYVPLDIDASDSDAPQSRRQLERFQVLGTPTLILLAPDFRTELFRASSFITPERFASILRYAGERSRAPNLRARAEYELHRRLIEGVRDRILAHRLLDTARLPTPRSCWAEANPATESCLRAEDARMKQLIEEHRQLEHDLVPDVVADTPILGIRIQRAASQQLVLAQVGPREPEQKLGTRNVEVGVVLDERTTLGWGEYRTVHRSPDGGTRGDRELHPGIEVLWRNGGDEVALVLLTDGFRRPSAWR